MQIEFYQTFHFQFEFLPRLTLMYGDVRLIAFEWLWFGVVVEFNTENIEDANIPPQ